MVVVNAVPHRVFLKGSSNYNKVLPVRELRASGVIRAANVHGSTPLLNGLCFGTARYLHDCLQQHYEAKSRMVVIGGDHLDDPGDHVLLETSDGHYLDGSGMHEPGLHLRLLNEHYDMPMQIIHVGSAAKTFSAKYFEPRVPGGWTRKLLTEILVRASTGDAFSVRL